MSQDQNASTGTPPRSTSPAATPPQSGADGFMASLADLESRINALKSLHEQAAARDAGLSSREQELIAREEQLTAQMQKLESRQKELDQQRTDADRLRGEREQELSQLKKQIESRQEELAKEIQEIKDQARADAQRRAEIESSEKRVQELSAKLEQQKTEAERLSKELAQKTSEMQREQEKRERDLARREESVAAKLSKVEGDLEKARRDQAEAAELRKNLAELEQVVADREKSLADREKTITLERKKALEERQTLTDQQQQREAAIAARQHELEEHEFDLKRQAEELARERASVNEHARSLAEQMKSNDDEHQAAIWSNRFESLQLQLGEQSAARARLETELAQCKEDVESMTQELIEANAAKGVPSEELERRDRTIEEITAQGEEAQATIQMLQQHLETSLRNVRATEEARAKDQAEKDAIAKKAADEMGAKLREVEEQAALLSEARHDLDAKSRELQRVSDELQENRRTMGELTVRAQSAERTLERMVPRERVQQLESELAAARELLDQAENAARSQVPAAQLKEREALIAGLQQAMAEAERNASELLREQAMARDQVIVTLRSQLEAAAGERSRELSEEVHRCEATITELKQRLHDAESEEAGNDAAAAAALAQVAQRDREIADLRKQIEEARAGTAADQRAEIELRDERIAALEAQVSQLAEQAQAQAQAHAEAAAENTEGAGVPPEEIIKRDEAIMLLKERLDQVSMERDELLQQAASSESMAQQPIARVNDEPTEQDLRRRDRLRRYKHLLQSQARKIVAAQNAIQKRHAECEMVLQQRQKLTQMAQQLSKIEKRVGGAKARTGAAAAVLYIVATLGILAFMSWHISSKIWPGTYVVKAVVEAESGRRTPAADDLAAWRSDHEQMIKDPRFAEFAAERMFRRGLTASPAAAELSNLLKNDLYIQSSKPGALSVELRGEGAERTTLTLDTIMTALKSFSDTGRDQRANDIGLTVAQAAAAGAEPLMDKRLEKAGAVLAGAALAAGLAGLIIWSRLVRAKRQFDQAAAIDSAMAEVEWGTLEASIKKNPLKNMPDK
ncbi:MAG: hypothetical protein K2W85_12865 [Phycisphaerales bacterium]|nr:hypothetical protein [Phycisphaerales bacterium]